ncbi:MAG TPA: hypothetical protein VHB20_00820 [Verrucomicrobiae bacterium]|jgi:hypothetical protein|nr:hypothetical protein [Verrucomicrobiae bacterium]
MNTNSALIVPAQPAGASNAPPPHFQEAIKPLIDIPNVWLWVIWIAVAIVAAVAAWLVWRYWRRQKAAASMAPPIPAHVRARRMLDEALRLIGEPKPFSIAVSGAIRVYLEERFQFHAPDRTTEEFLYELQGTNLLTEEQKRSLADFLANCDLIKFAKYEPTEQELRGLHEAALRLVNETEPRVAPEPAGAPVEAAK